MGNLVETAVWEPGIYQLETNDPVMGGPNGIDNLQAKQLAARTNALKGMIDTHALAADPHSQYVKPNQMSKLVQKVSEMGCGVIIPFYQYPANVFTNNAVLQLAYTIQHNPHVNFLIVINPANGTGPLFDGNYGVLIDILHGAGAKVLGYVHTTYAARTLAAVEADIASWTALYPAIDGIFIDEMNNTNAATDIPYYTALTNYCHQSGFAPVVANPGAVVAASYFAAADIIMYVETNGYPTEASLAQFFAGGSGVGVTPAQKAAVVYNVAFNEAAIKVMQKYAKWLYVTDGLPANPYLVVSSYINTFARYISQMSGDSSEPFLAANPVLPNHALTLGAGDVRYAQSAQMVMTSGVSGQTFSIPQLLGGVSKKLMLQTGITPVVAAGTWSTGILFPVAFPTACLGVFPVWNAVNGFAGAIEVTSVSPTGFQVGSPTAAVTACAANYIAIGY